jgi:hypothetical protein
MAAKRPGLLTRTGLHTFLDPRADPRHGGGTAERPRGRPPRRGRHPPRRGVPLLSGTPRGRRGDPWHDGR